jgi:catechol 2,3-dioxygenase-like lactoylglutathione lyase family enzyme
MKRLQVHVSVGNLAASIRFYSARFGHEPTMTKPNYAEWQLDDPRVNFAISNGHTKTGLNPLGIQTDSDEELDNLRTQMNQAEVAGAAADNVACCYHRSNKYSVTDPTGITWETFHTFGAVPLYGDENSAEVASGCCTDAAGPAKIEVKPRVHACCS